MFLLPIHNSYSKGKELVVRPELLCGKVRNKKFCNQYCRSLCLSHKPSGTKAVLLQSSLGGDNAPRYTGSWKDLSKGVIPDLMY